MVSHLSICVSALREHLLASSSSSLSSSSLLPDQSLSLYSSLSLFLPSLVYLLSWPPHSLRLSSPRFCFCHRTPRASTWPLHTGQRQHHRQIYFFLSASLLRSDSLRRILLQCVPCCRLCERSKQYSDNLVTFGSLEVLWPSPAHGQTGLVQRPLGMGHNKLLAFLGHDRLLGPG